MMPSETFGSLTFVLLIVALGIFVLLSAKSRSVRSFQFQISLFLLIWIAGEILDLAVVGGSAVSLGSDGELGMYVHTSAMVMFGAMMWLRFYFSRRSGKKVADTLEEG
ncbi:MAG TPA: hypothetical protein VJP79_03470 [Nitrososphaera sp.]|nr:hypothetical protein [Nitrososphaera sp.]